MVGSRCSVQGGQPWLAHSMVVGRRPVYVRSIGRTLPSSLFARSKRPLAECAGVGSACTATGQSYDFWHAAGVGGQVCAIVALVVDHARQAVDDVAGVCERPWRTVSHPR